MSSAPQTPLSTDEVITQWLLELPTRQRLALRLHLVDGLKQTDAAQRLGISQGQFSTNFNNARQSLNNKARNASQAYPIQEARIKAVLESIPLTSEEQQILGSSGLKDIKKEASEQPTPAPPPRQFNWVPLAGVIGALLAGLLVGRLAAPVAQPTQVTVVTTPTSGPTQTARVETTVVERVVEVTAPPGPTQTPFVHEVQVTAPPAPTQPPITVIVSLTPGPTQTPVVVTATPGPTEAPIATSEAILPVSASTPEASASPLPTTVGSISLPFSDNFDTGLSDTWKVVSGDWNMRNKQITNLSGPGLIWLGKQNWTDVAVEVEIFGGYCNGSTNILIRMQDPSNYIAFQAIGCNSEGLYLIKDGKNQKQLVYTGGQRGKIKIVAIGSVYTVYNANGESVGTAGDKTFSSGSVGIQMDSPGLAVDNLKVDVPQQ